MYINYVLKGCYNYIYESSRRGKNIYKTTIENLEKETKN